MNRERQPRQVQCAGGHAGPIALANEARKLADYGNRVEELRRAVNKTATVQCADCRQWIDADKNHTCKQQVKRNRKRGTK